jgi:hypothetical protein
MRPIAIIVTCLALVVPASALAQSSTCQAYNPQICGVTSTSQTTDASGSSTLPFTGLDLLLLAAGGATLLGAGLLVRRLARGSGDEPEPPY